MVSFGYIGGTFGGGGRGNACTAGPKCRAGFYWLLSFLKTFRKSVPPGTPPPRMYAFDCLTFSELPFFQASPSSSPTTTTTTARQSHFGFISRLKNRILPVSPETLFPIERQHVISGDQIAFAYRAGPLTTSPFGANQFLPSRATAGQRRTHYPRNVCVNALFKYLIAAGKMTISGFICISVLCKQR